MPAVQVALGGAAVVGRAPLVVADPLADQPRADEQHDRGGRVERPVHGVGHAAERLAGDARSVSVHSVIRGAMPDASVPERDQHADDEDELVRLRQLQALHGGKLLPTTARAAT